MTSLAATVASPEVCRYLKPKPHRAVNNGSADVNDQQGRALEVISEAGSGAVGKSSSTLGGDLDRHLHRRLIQTARRTERGPGPTPGLSLTDVDEL
jgi:hypothetical protein